MGKAARLRPARLGEKLLQIRQSLGLSQNGMLQRVKVPSTISREHISAFELGKREPPLPVLLQYARTVGLTIDDLVDDEEELPKRLADKGSRAKRR